MGKSIRIAVRTLVEFVLRAGDIDLRFTGSERMLEGAQAHRRIQKAAGAQYQAEVTLSDTFEYRGFEITLEGRADGVIDGPDGVVVDEIKSTTRPLDSITEDFSPLHWAQAQCYAHMLARRKGLGSVTVQLTYCAPEGDAVNRMRRTYTAQELADFVTGLFDRYIVWAQYEDDRAARRDEAIRALPFPYPAYRPGQREMAAAVYRAIVARAALFAQAPTGIGKTVSALFPAVKAMGEGHVRKIFYLTAKTVTRTVAQEALRQMEGLAPAFKTVTLTAKDRICPHPGTACNPDACELAKGYYDRLGDALADILGHESLMPRETVQAYAGRYGLCPFEFGLDISEWADCIICDYNYVFDPIVYLRRFFQNGGDDYVFLTDEAHNLVDRAREMYSASLTKSAFLGVRRQYRDRDRRLAQAAGDVNARLLALRRECEAAPDGNRLVRQEEDAGFLRSVGGFVRQAGRWLMLHPGEEADELLEVYFDSLAFIRIASFYNERYVTFVTADGPEVCFRLCCLDPSELLAATLASGRAAVFFSATLSPLPYFRNILGGGPSGRLLSLPSPFRPENLCLLVADGVSTRYRDRTGSCGAVAGMIAAMVAARSGNYLVFFPSYQYMSDVLDTFAALCPQIRTVRQQPQMDEAAREDFLSRFASGPTETLAGFCVLGGIFSEGIDLPGDRLIGAAIVGVGLPQLSEPLNLIRRYYDRRGGQGYEYAYMYPGMNKVLQAAGRVIRSESDRGAVLLIDDRYTRGDYRALFPAHWSHFTRVRGAEDVRRRLVRFWAGG